MDSIVLTPVPLNELIEQIREVVRAELLKANQQPGPAESSELFLSIEEAATFLGIAKSTLYGLTSTRKVPFMKVGKLIRFSKIELIDWIKSGKRNVRKSLSL